MDLLLISKLKTGLTSKKRRINHTNLIPTKQLILKRKLEEEGLSVSLLVPDLLNIKNQRMLK